MKNTSGWKAWLKLLYHQKDIASLEKLLDLFLTPEEKENYATRVLLIQELLKNKKTQRDIAADLDISIAKITRGSNALKTLDQKTLEKLKTALS